MPLYLTSICAFLWAGMILGISFFESWVKFKTPALDKVVGLNVGRTVFFYFHRLQMGWFVLLIILTLLSDPTRIEILFLAILFGILMLQTYWIFPILSQRVDELARGKKLPHSCAHGLYGVGELIKFFVLFALGIEGYGVLFF
ncbi:Uncharacterised protein [Legionella steigerwaltii]|uniref:DUF4149 domain-containing protein n=1 Tax=Legionella steigerwaltii TaxID=460 RepID=A0A378L5R1_9GAMM|nr:hypothetical protein [Legionella steigerwaltii]KTD80323.1 hypothetical protein Lstg_0585 [Legionella steigerwaltii]STY22405.1 Uncharacterised protein [Legionella steigerwaltii]